MKTLLKFIVRNGDWALSPFVFFSALILKAIRRTGIENTPICKSILLKVGVFPICDHYYEPLFNPGHLNHALEKTRNLTGIDWNMKEQLCLIEGFSYNEELRQFPIEKVTELGFYIGNTSFGSGDSEFLYNLIRAKKPRRIIEIGSGNSTTCAIQAVKRNGEESPDYSCTHICIEPYEMPWLEKTGVKVIRQRVELVDASIFQSLQENDLLFIDSSHMVRPQGDVLFEILELLPTLNPGVIVHVHDIFSPRDYPRSWIIDKVYFWNEQYLLEAFLTSNTEWKIIGALNYLHHEHYDTLKLSCPFLTRSREPGSFYIQKIR